MINPFPSKTKTLEGNGSLKINWSVHFEILCPGEHTRKLSQKESSSLAPREIFQRSFVAVHYGKLSQAHTRENKFKSRIKFIRGIFHEKFRNTANFKQLLRTTTKVHPCLQAILLSLTDYMSLQN